MRAYRLLLTAAGALLLLAAPWAGLAPLLQSLREPGLTPPELAFFTMAVAAVGTGWLTINFPGRAHVTLVIIPVGLALWQFGLAGAELMAAVSALAANTTRRGTPFDVVSRATRVFVPTCVGIFSAWSIMLATGSPQAGAHDGAPLVVVWGLPALALALGAAAGESALDALERRWLPGAWAEAAPAMEIDLLTNLLAAPVLVALGVVGMAFGLDRLSALLAGLVGLLIVVRSDVNLRTFDAALEQAHQIVSAEREKLDTLFASSGEGIYTVDRDLRITALNPAMVSLLGQSAGSEARLIGGLCEEICHFEDAAGEVVCPDRCPLLRAHTTGTPVSEELVHRSADGEPKHLLVTYSAVTGAGGGLDVGVAVGRDVTAQREAERLREEFVSLVTHELRSPLTASLGNLDLMRRLLTRAADAEALDADRLQTLVERVTSTERHLVRLVDNLLDLARVERADLPLELDEVDAGEIVAREVALVEGQAAAKRLTIVVDRPPAGAAIRTSGLYLGHIAGNLIANAVKYTPPEGRIEVRVAVNALPEPVAHAPSVAMPPPERWVEVRVRDTGYGIGEQDQARLFSRFFRSGREEIRRERGTGLGLALTKQMVDRLGGTISVQSALGVGSTFTVVLPSLPAGANVEGTGPDTQNHAGHEPLST